MVESRQKAFGSISRVLAITRYDIEQRQLVNDLSLNIHGENYFRDILNFVYEYNLTNDNFESQNSSCIDLVDKKLKIAYQVTTTRDKEKLDNTFKALSEDKYKGYSIRILYLLEKAKPNNTTRIEYKDKYGIEINDCLVDYTDLLRKINDLETTKLIQLEEKYFHHNANKYTNEIVLDLVFKHLITNCKTVDKNYDDDFGTVDTHEKIVLNQLNDRTAYHINSGLDYVSIVAAGNEDNILADLRALVIEDLYKNILKGLLASKISAKEIEHKPLLELQQLAKVHTLNFNKIINNLHKDIEAKVEIKDYNSMSISWIIIAFFFEICDIGVKS